MAEDRRHGLLLKRYVRPANMIKTMLTQLVSTRETPEITLCEHVLLGIILIGCG